MKITEIKELPEILFPTVELADLPDSGCKWPYENLMCCGRQRLEGKPYCQEHYDHIRPAHGTKPYTPDLHAQAQMKLQGGIQNRRPKPRPHMTLLPRDIG